MFTPRLICIIFFLLVHVTTKAQDILLQKPLPFAPFDTMANGRLLVVSKGNLENYQSSCNCKLKQLKIDYLPEKGDFHSMEVVKITNGNLPPDIQIALRHLRSGDKLFLSNIVFQCQDNNCSKNSNIGSIILKVIKK